MQTLLTAGIPVDQIAHLERYAESEAGAEMRKLLLDLTRYAREGIELAPIVSQNTLTPNQVADQLGMSRTHLYKLLDQDHIKSHRVGRDRRIHLADVRIFAAQQQDDQHELANKFAHQHDTRDAAVNEIADTL